MIRHAWQTYLQSAAAPADAAAAAGTPTGPGLAHLPVLAAVRFEGADVRKFLQGYLTCDTDDLTTDTLVPTALCNLKGRVVMNGWCAAVAEDAVLLVLHDSLVERLAAFLRPYLMFSKTTLSDLRDDALVLGGLDLADDAGGLPLDARRRLFVVDDLDQARRLWETHPHSSEQSWLAALTADGVPLVSDPVRESFLPQMLNLESLGAIDFAKGCYLGQEVVARAQHRGQVKRRLTTLTWRGAAAPPPGGEVVDDDGRSVGTVVQSARLGEDGGPLLAVLSQDASDHLRQGDVDLRRAG